MSSLSNVLHLRLDLGKEVGQLDDGGQEQAASGCCHQGIVGLDECELLQWARRSEWGSSREP